MKQTLGSAFLLFSLFSSTNILADNCTDPFNGISTTFTLSENACDAQKGTHLDISTDYFIEANCIDEKKIFNLKDKNNQVLYQSDWLNAHSAFEIDPTCGGLAIAIMLNSTREVQGIGLVKYSAYSTRYPNPYPTAFVLVKEDQAEQIKIQSTNGTQLTLAKKTMVNGSSCLFKWDVNYTQIDPLTIAFLLAWKENAQLNCTIQPNPFPFKYLSFLVIPVGALAVIATGIFAWKLKSPTYTAIEN